MGKRTISDLVEDGVPTGAAAADGSARKKSRKDKDREGSGKKRKATNIAISGEVETVDDAAVMEQEDGGGKELSKAERKAARQARREAKEAKKVGTDSGDLKGQEKLKEKKQKKVDVNGSAAQEVNGDKQVQDEAAAKAARKAARKAEKAKKKGKSTEDEGNGKIAEIHANGTARSRAHDVPAAMADSSGYEESKELTALPQSEIDSYMTTHTVSIEDPLPSARKLRPIVKFSYLPAVDESQKAPFASFTAPTPIQAATWPALLSGRDMVGVAETGSGKTLAFGVPCIRFISSLPKKQQKGVKAVIVSPTRELAVQIHDQLVQLAKPAGLEVVCVYGGVAKEPQVKAVRTAHIVVATPGRLNDLIGDGSADLSKAEYVVLDEADRMLDKGFEEAIRQIIGCTPKKRQTLMFTATWPPSVRELASTFMKTPVRITIGDNASGELRANTRIKQLVEVVDPRGKETRLLQLLKQYQSGKNKDDRILVFCLYKKEAVRIENFINSKGFRVGGIHGDLSQDKRSASLAAFKEGHVPLLVATDVAARGLDIPAVKVVINVTFPLTAEDYVHRIGRTGRAGKEGLAITLFTEHDKALSGALINVLKAANQAVPEDLLKFGTTVKKKEHGAYGAFYKDVDMTKKATKVTFD